MLVTDGEERRDASCCRPTDGAERPPRGQSLHSEHEKQPPLVALKGLNNVGSGLVLLEPASPSTSSFRRTEPEPEPEPEPDLSLPASPQSDSLPESGCGPYAAMATASVPCKHSRSFLCFLTYVQLCYSLILKGRSRIASSHANPTILYMESCTRTCRESDVQASLAFHDTWEIK